jgi:tetratricopeptide (TPR) repeat protein
MRRRALAAFILVALIAPAYADGVSDIAAASAAAQAQDFNRAAQLYGHALADADLTPFNQALAHDGRGAAYFQLKQYDRAISDYTAAIKLQPDCAPCYNNRGMAYGEKDLAEAAIIDFNDAIRLAPQDFNGYFNRGNVYYSKNDYDHAIADYTAAIGIRADCAACYHNRGVAEQGASQFDKANEDLNTADQMKH